MGHLIQLGEFAILNSKLDSCLKNEYQIRIGKIFNKIYENRGHIIFDNPIESDNIVVVTTTFGEDGVTSSDDTMQPYNITRTGFDYYINEDTGSHVKAHYNWIAIGY